MGRFGGEMKAPTTFTQFDYLLNSMELAGKQDTPAEHGYGDKRRALYAYVRDLEARSQAEDALPLTLAQQALDALEYHQAQTRPIEKTAIAITALRAAIEKPSGVDTSDKTKGN
jgi:hypothetical protein